MERTEGVVDVFRIIFHQLLLFREREKGTMQISIYRCIVILYLYRKRIIPCRLCLSSLMYHAPSAPMICTLHALRK